MIELDSKEDLKQVLDSWKVPKLNGMIRGRIAWLCRELDYYRRLVKGDKDVRPESITTN